MCLMRFCSSPIEVRRFCQGPRYERERTGREGGRTVPWGRAQNVPSAHAREHARRRVHHTYERDDQEIMQGVCHIMRFSLSQIGLTRRATTQYAHRMSRRVNQRVWGHSTRMKAGRVGRPSYTVGTAQFEGGQETRSEQTAMTINWYVSAVSVLENKPSVDSRRCLFTSRLPSFFILRCSHPVNLW